MKLLKMIINMHHMRHHILRLIQLPISKMRLQLTIKRLKLLQRTN